jgi:hypothetical protein
MFRILIPRNGAMSAASNIWINASRGGSDASRDEARGIRHEPGAFLIYDAS